VDLAAESGFGGRGSPHPSTEEVTVYSVCSHALPQSLCGCRKFSETRAGISWDNFPAPGSVTGGGRRGRLLCQACGRLRSGSAELEG